MTSSAGPTPWPDGIDMLRFDGYAWAVRSLLAILEEYVEECGECEKCTRAMKLMAKVEAWNGAMDV